MPHFPETAIAECGASHDLDYRRLTPQCLLTEPTRVFSATSGIACTGDRLAKLSDWVHRSPLRRISAGEQARRIEPEPSGAICLLLAGALKKKTEREVGG